MQPKTLYDFYGGNLPKIQERAKTYESLGLGKATDYIGSADQNVSLLNSLNRTTLVPNTSVPSTTSINASAIKDTPQLQPPVGNVSNPATSVLDRSSVFANRTGDAKTDLTNITNSVVDKARSNESTLNTKIEEQNNLFDQFVNALSKRPSESNLREQGLAGLGVNEKIAQASGLTTEINNLRDELAKLEAEGSAAVASIEGQGRGIPLGILALQKDKIERQYAARKSAVSAMLAAKSANQSAIQGDIALARSFVNDGIQAKLNDFNQKINDFRDLYTFNKDIIDSLTTEQKNALNAEYKLLQDQATEQQNNLTKIGQLMIDNPRAGVTFEDTFETAIEKVKRAGGSISARTESRLSSGDDGEDDGFKFTPAQINKGIANSGLTREAFLSLDGETKNILINSPKTSDFFGIIKGIETGVEDYDVVLSEIDEGNLPQSTKDYFRSLAVTAKAVRDNSKTVSEEKKGFWAKLKSLFVN